MLGVSEQNQAGHPTLGWIFSASWTQRTIVSISVKKMNKSNFTPNLSQPGDLIRWVSIFLFMTYNHFPKTGVCSPCLSELPRVPCFIDETPFSDEWLPSDCTDVKTLRCRDFIFSPWQHNCSLSLKKKHWLHHHPAPGQCTGPGWLSREK